MKKKVLINDMLFDNNIVDIDYEYCYQPYIVGIAKTNKNEKREYNIYCTDDRGYISILKQKDTFNEAILYAQKMYQGMLSYYRGIMINYTKINNKKRGK